MTTFHEVRFPTDVSLGARGGPEWRTDVVTMRSGYEQANSTWVNSRRKYNAGYGIKNIDQLALVLEFFEERRGKLYGFRWKDRLDFKSCSTPMSPSAFDQVIGIGDASTRTFQLTKTYGRSFAPWSRIIKKPVTNTVRIGINGSAYSAGWTVDTTTGIVTFSIAPGTGYTITAGFEFDVPVRFDTDYLEFDLSHFSAGQVPSIPIIELRV
ncbi:MAG: DUF2460 domain-containing protein [Ancalomicrobiaceae bacterium]|nr:DUF2460 domain-containing protein [Ancalomicrobiaceae bacterium]